MIFMLKKRGIIVKENNFTKKYAGMDKLNRGRLKK